MKKILFIVIFLISSCSNEEEVEAFYEKWVKDNYDSLNKIDALIYENADINKIRTVGENVEFSNVKGGSKTYIELAPSHELRSLLPKHANMLYLSNDKGAFIGVGVTSECEKYVCSIGVAKPREGKFGPACTNAQTIREGFVCYKHLHKEWYLQYQYLHKNT